MGCTCAAEIKDPNQLIIRGERENKNENVNSNKNDNHNNDNNKVEKVQVQRDSKRKEISFDKEKCVSINSTIPTRVNTNLQSLKDIMKSKTQDLSEVQKSYVLFLWICQNVNYDAEGYFAGRNVDCTPEGVFRNGKTVCSGYARLYREIALYLGLNVECVNCYAKGVGYEPGQKVSGTNHEYNVINLNSNWYPLDSTWGAGHIEGNQFKKEFNEFYFLPNPELLIKTHFPENEKWQLTEKKYTIEEFLKWPKINNNFNKYEFNKYYPEEGFINLKDKNTQKFKVWGNNIKKRGLTCNTFLLEGNSYNQQLNTTMVNFIEDRFEVDCVFNKKGRYRVLLYGKNKGQQMSQEIISYVVNVENDAKEELKFPHNYSGSEDINIIEPLYDNLKTGDKVKFKIKSALDSIIIVDGKWYYLERNEQGFFEEEITIQSLKGGSLIVGKKNENNGCSYLVQYSIN